jgi:hypothetical protein
MKMLEQISRTVVVTTTPISAPPETDDDYAREFADRNTSEKIISFRNRSRAFEDSAQLAAEIARAVLFI